MKKYVIFPALGVAIFAIFFWRFNADFDSREKQQAEAKRVELENKRKAEFELKKKAVEEAIAIQEKRKVEKAEREKREADEKQLQLDLKDAADRARDDKDRVLRQVDKLKTEIEFENAALKKLAAEKANLVAEDEFLQKYVKVAEDNQKNLEAVLAKIEEASKKAELFMAQNAKKKS